MTISSQGEVISPDGIIPGRNRTGSAIAKHLFVEPALATGIDCVTVSNASADRPQGVTMEPIPDQMNGNVCKRGRVLVRAGGNIAAGAAIMPGTDGRAITAASGGRQCGRSLENWAAVADDILLVDLDCTNPPLVA